MAVSKIGLGVAAAAVTGVLVVGGAALADAASTPSPSASGSSGASSGPATGEGGRGGGGSSTPVTGSEATRASAAVTAKDPAVSVSGVRKDADGSYDVEATKAGAPVAYEVSADLKTITERVGGHGHDGGRGGSSTPVTGSEGARASAAVTAKDPAVSVSGVRKDADGSYDVEATKAGAPVAYEVSADLKTITERVGGHGHGHDHGAPGGAEGGAEGGTPSGGAQQSSSATA